MKSGETVKTDRRDQMMLPKLHIAGELTAICRSPHDSDNGC
jgi:hypothetical protein